MSDTTGKDDELEQTYRQEAQYALHLLSLPAEDRPVHIMLRAKELLAARKQYGIQERIDERKRVSYEHESFTHEWFKDRVRNLKIWWHETASDAHTRRIESLNRELTALKDSHFVSGHKMGDKQEVAN